MRIAVASDGLDVSERFSRCTNFNYYKVANNELVDSCNLPSEGHLCGSQASFLSQIEVKILICNSISKPEIEQMNRVGITVVTGAKGNALQAADAYLHGQLEGCSVAGA